MRRCRYRSVRRAMRRGLAPGRRAPVSPSSPSTVPGRPARPPPDRLVARVPVGAGTGSGRDRADRDGGAPDGARFRARVHDRLAGRTSPAPPQRCRAVVRALVRLAGVWRERLLRRCLAGHHDWTEAGRTSRSRGRSPTCCSARAAALPTRGCGRVAASGSRTASTVRPPGSHGPATLPVASAFGCGCLRRKSAACGPDRTGSGRPPAVRGMGRDGREWRRAHARAGLPGAGRLLLELRRVGRDAQYTDCTRSTPTPAPSSSRPPSSNASSEAGWPARIRTAHPLVEADLYDDPLARLIPDDARARLRPADWPSLFRRRRMLRPRPASATLPSR